MATSREQHADEGDILPFLEQRLVDVEELIAQQRGVRQKIQGIIQQEYEAREIMDKSNFEIEEKQVEDQMIAGIRMKGQYSECGKGFARLGRSFGRYISGKPFLLQYDREFKEDGADFEACVPISKEKEVSGIDVRELPGGRCVSLLHQGPYEELHRSYQKIIAHLEKNSLQSVCPSREVYLKGPGMIFRGNPKKYLTEIQFLIDEDAS